MSQRPIPESVLQERLALYRRFVDQGMLPYRTTFPRSVPSATVEAAKLLGINVQTMARSLEEASRRGYGLPDAAMPSPGFVIKERSARYDADGNLLQQSIKSAPERTETFDPIPGHSIKGESVLLDADGRVSARWIKTRETAQTTTELIAALKESMSEISALPLIHAPGYSDQDLMTVYPLPDLHLGMMAWGKESGEDYDLKIATQVVLSAVQDLVAQSKPSGRAVILGLGDYFHANDQTGMTPRSKHILDTDGRWQKVLLAGCRLAKALVELALQKHDTVTVRFLPGNHDPDAAHALSIALYFAFEGNPRVTVDIDPSHHWYIRFGKVLIGATHGHTMKPDKMALMLASDRPKDWGESVFRHFLFGHVHHDSAKDAGPVRVESFRSPAAKDAYAAAGGWRALRTLLAVTFHAERGEKFRHFVHITPET